MRKADQEITRRKDSVGYHNLYLMVMGSQERSGYRRGYHKLFPDARDCCWDISEIYYYDIPPLTYPPPIFILNLPYI